MRYSLRTLLVLVATFCVLLGLLMLKVEQKKIEARAMTVIGNRGGSMRMGRYHLGTVNGEMVYPPEQHTVDRFCRDWFGENFLLSATSVDFWGPIYEENDFGCSCDGVNDFRFDADLVEALQALPDLETICIECSQTIPRENIEYAQRALPKVTFEFYEREMLGANNPPPFAPDD